MMVRRVCIMVALLGAGWLECMALDGQGSGPFDLAIEAARTRVVKLYGGGLGRTHGYGSGVLVSSDGQVVTTLSVLLESPALRVVLADGSRYPATILRRDETRQLALLKIEAEGLEFFKLTDSAHLRTGDWLIAAGNPFKVADGPEPISVATGVLAGRANLAALRRKQEFSYMGPVLITDVITSTPGSAGGALLDIEGRFVGLIGKTVTSKRTNTWINYALPCEQIAAFVRGDSEPTKSFVENEETPSPQRPDLGIVLFDVGGRERPAYVERVRPDSPAAAAGICSNDLILSLGGEAIGTCEDFYAVRARLHVNEQVTVVLKRASSVETVELTVGARQ